MKNIKNNTFHIIHEGSKTGHPGMIYWKSDENNLYLAITTGSTEFNNEHFLKLNKVTSEDVKTSFINKRPLLAKRKDIAEKEITNMSFKLEDYEIILKVKKNKPRYTPSINRHDKLAFRKIKP